MRVIERQTLNRSPRYLVARAVGFCAGAFALLACALIAINNAQLRSSDPMNNAVLEQMKAGLTPATDDPALIETIRELDRLARQAYFSAEHFNQQGIVFMLVCLVVMVGSLKYAGSLVKEDAYPDPTTPKRDLVEEGELARSAFAGGAIVLIGFLLMTAMLWESPLDAEQPVGEVASAEVSVKEPDVVPAAVLIPPTREELLDNWPTFLGTSRGFAQGSALPHDWSSADALRWKAEIPLPGFGSPILWGDQIFLPGASADKREVFCFAADTGQLRWRFDVSGLPGAVRTPPKVTDDTGYAAATMVTEGNLVFAVFATGALVALDLEGELVWSRQLGLPDNPYGHASSPVIGDGLLFVQYDQRSEAKLLALDLADGKTRWEVARDLGASWATPLFFEHGGQPQLALAAESALVSYAAADGRELWRVACLRGAEVACAPVVAGGFLYAAADYASVLAIDLETKEIAWQYEDLTPGVSTPLVVGDYLVAGLSEGGIVCVNAKSGEEIWFEMTDEGFYASPILVGENVYLLDRVGGMHIFQLGSEYKSVAHTSLEEEATCTPAFIDGSLFVRGTKHLYRFGL